MEKELGVLYADISGSTRLYRTLGTEEAKHQLERCVKRMERSIESFKGSLVAPSFDEMVATFPTADDVLQAALDMQRRIADLPPVSGIRLTIRIGIHFGGVIDAPDGISGSAAEIGKSLLNLAGAGQIISCDLTSRALSKTYLENLFPIADMSLSTPFGESQLLEVKERPGRTVFRPTATTTASTPHLQERLFVRIDGKAYVVDNAAPRMSFGRDKDCSHTLHGSKASRHHAVIEKRGRNGFVLIDQSTNGTYLKIEEAGELKLQQGEAIIAGSGKIGFGHSTELEGDVVEVELV
jgi:adenylate cyclase